MPKPVILAHRGVRNEIPENTVPSIELALTLPGVYGVEFDVELADAPCVVHQETMVPNADFSALELSTRDYTTRDWVGESKLKDITSLDAGSWFAPNFSHLRVPTLTEVLCCNWQDKVAFLELKDPTYWSVQDKSLPQRLVQAVSPMLHQFKGRMEVISFNPEILCEMARQFPEIPRVLVLWTEWKGKRAEAIEQAMRTKATTIGIPDVMLLEDVQWLEDVHAAGQMLYTYPVSPSRDEPEYRHWTPVSRKPVWEKLLELSVDGIVSDFPRELLALLA